MSKPSHPIAISLNFDFEQVNQMLTWKAVDEQTHRSAYHERGPHAGGMFLPVDESISIIVTGGAHKDCVPHDWDYKVLQCYLITLPHELWLQRTHGRQFSPPSPFVAAEGQVGGAVRDIPASLFEGPFPDNGDKAYVASYYEAKNVLKVIPKTQPGANDLEGRWEMTFILTVQVIPKDGSAPFLRVFSFDPETEVGTVTR